jgi:hypothetical protein
MSCNIWECPSLAHCFYILIFLVHIYLTDGVQSMVPGVLTCYFVWSSTLYLATLCGSYSVGMLPEVVYDIALDKSIFGLFFGILIFLEFCLVLLAHKDAWERCWEVSNFFLVMFMFILFFSSYGTLDILLDALDALDNPMGGPGFLTFHFIYLFIGLGLDNLSIMPQTLGVLLMCCLDFLMCFSTLPKVFWCFLMFLSALLMFQGCHSMFPDASQCSKHLPNMVWANQEVREPWLMVISLQFYWMLESGGLGGPWAVPWDTWGDKIKRIISAKVIDENKSTKTVCNLILFVFITNCYPNCISF